jgi:hypothetical protein
MGNSEESASSETPEQPPPLPDDAVVIRGGISAPDSLRKTALAHHDEEGDFAISVASLAGVDGDALAGLARFSHPRIRETTVGRVRAEGYDVVPDPPPDWHALIMLPHLPADDDWTRISNSFDPPRDNPSLELQEGGAPGA